MSEKVKQPPEDADDDVSTEEASADEVSAEEVSTDEASTDESPVDESGKKELGADEVYCTSCGEPIKSEAELCPHCGVRQGGAAGGAPVAAQKNPGVAAVASFFFAGLGQIYNGQLAKGILLMVVQAINVALIFVLIGFFTYPIVWAYGMWDAYRTAEKINRGEVTV